MISERKIQGMGREELIRLVNQYDDLLLKLLEAVGDEHVTHASTHDVVQRCVDFRKLVHAP